METKTLLRSKTFWWNIITTAGGAALSQIAPTIDPETFLLINAAGNILLRVITRKKISGVV